MQTIFPSFTLLLNRDGQEWSNFLSHNYVSDQIPGNDRCTPERIFPVKNPKRKKD